MTLYTTHCPNCQAIESMLKKKNLEFDIVDDKDEIVEVGRANKILSAPILEVDGKFYKFADALKVIRSIEG